MIWKDWIDQSLESLNNAPIHSKMHRFLPVLSKCGFFQFIENPTLENYQLFASILKYLGSHSNPSAFGLGLGCMAMANLCGEILNKSNRKIELNQITGGQAIYSMAVSERGWKGRLKNIQTVLKESRDSTSSQLSFILKGEKNFATNGRQSDFYIVIAKTSDRFVPVIIPRNISGLEIQAFDLPACEEATHAELKFHNIIISESQILDLDYKAYGRFLPAWERFSFHFLILGFLDSIFRSLEQGELPNQISILLKGKENELRKDFQEVEKKIYERLSEVAQSGIESMKLRDSMLFVSLMSEYFFQPEWEEIYPPFLIIRKLFPLIPPSGIV